MQTRRMHKCIELSIHTAYKEQSGNHKWRNYTDRPIDRSTELSNQQNERGRDRDREEEEEKTVKTMKHVFIPTEVLCPHAKAMNISTEKKKHKRKRNHDKGGYFFPSISPSLPHSSSIRCYNTNRTHPIKSRH